MIAIIGFKRIAILSVLVLLVAALGAGSYLYFAPQNQKLERDLRGLRGQIASKRTETTRLASEYEQIQEQKTYFQNLENAGFFTDQNRAVASRYIEEIQKFSRVLATRYEINSAEVKESKPAEQAGHVIIDSPIVVDIDAIDDIDLFNFIYWMESALPGHVSVNNMELQLTGELTEPKLRGIGQGKSVTMIKGNVTFDWQTMIPKEQAGTAQGRGYD